MEDKIEKMHRAVGYVDGTRLSRIRNIPQISNNSTGVVDVYFDKRSEKYRASLKFKGVLHRLGYFTHLEEAATARKKAEQLIFGEFLESLNEKEDEENE